MYDVMYNGAHSITFGNGTFTSAGKLNGKNTWKDWHLIPNKRPDASIPGVVTRLVTIPGRDGTIDMSEYLTGKPNYGDRTGSWEFIVDNGHEGWTTIRSNITEYLHGKRMKCVLEDDPNYYYEGRFQVKWESDEKYSKVTIEYVMTPYKTHWNPNGNWLWDPFNFELDRTDQQVATRL